MEFRTDAPSYTRNNARGAVHVPAIHRLRAAGSGAGAACAPRAGVRSGARVVARVVVVVAGEHEGLLDSIEATARAIAEEVQDTTVFSCLRLEAYLTT